LFKKFLFITIIYNVSIVIFLGVFTIRKKRLKKKRHTYFP
jgi:hypothetical protein